MEAHPIARIDAVQSHVVVAVRVRNERSEL